VGLARVELATRSLGNCCSIHLSYSPTPQFYLTSQRRCVRRQQQIHLAIERNFAAAINCVIRALVLLYGDPSNAGQTKKTATLKN
jgi:hypothetical protein